MKKLKLKRSKLRFMRPAFAEWLVGSKAALKVFPVILGLPMNWTDPRPGAVDRASFHDLFPPPGDRRSLASLATSQTETNEAAPRPEVCLSLFSGVGGLELATRQPGTDLTDSHEFLNFA